MLRLRPSPGLAATGVPFRLPLAEAGTTGATGSTPASQSSVAHLADQILVLGKRVSEQHELEVRNLREEIALLSTKLAATASELQGLKSGRLRLEKREETTRPTALPSRVTPESPNEVTLLPARQEATLTPVQNKIPEEIQGDAAPIPVHGNTSLERQEEAAKTPVQSTISVEREEAKTSVQGGTSHERQEEAKDSLPTDISPGLQEEVPMAAEQDGMSPERQEEVAKASLPSDIHPELQEEATKTPAPVPWNISPQLGMSRQPPTMKDDQSVGDADELVTENTKPFGGDPDPAEEQRTKEMEVPRFPGRQMSCPGEDDLHPTRPQSSSPGLLSWTPERAARTGIARVVEVHKKTRSASFEVDRRQLDEDPLVGFAEDRETCCNLSSMRYPVVPAAAQLRSGLGFTLSSRQGTLPEKVASRVPEDPSVVPATGQPLSRKAVTQVSVESLHSRNAETEVAI